MSAVTAWLTLEATSDSKITAVTVYPGHAEVTRNFPLKLEAGVTEVSIVGALGYTGDLPNILRLEKEGSAVLRDVKITQTAQGSDQSTPISEPVSQLRDLQNQKELLEKSLSRCKSAPVLFDKCIASVDMGNMSMEGLDRLLEAYEKLGRKWDERVQSLGNQIQEVEEKIVKETPSKERTRPKGDLKSSMLDIRFVLEAADAIDAHVRLVYGVGNASWVAEYDITTICNEAEEKVSLTYKAAVTNETAESWDDVTLTLGTVASPPQGRNLPAWEVSLGNPTPPTQAGTFLRSTRYIPNAKHLVNGGISVLKGPTPTMVTIADLKPPVSFERFCTPRINCDVRLIAKISNDNEYPFCAGEANVYLNENFILKTCVGVTCTGEAFDIPLGIDPTVHLTYYPFTKTIVADRLKSPLHTFHHCSRRITISNSRGITIPSLIVIDSIPAENKLRSRLEWPTLYIRQDSLVQVVDKIPEGSSVTARWDDVEEPWTDTERLGQNGKINWVCIVGPGAEFDLDLRWTVEHLGTGRIGYF